MTLAAGMLWAYPGQARATQVFDQSCGDLIRRALSKL